MSNQPDHSKERHRVTAILFWGLIVAGVIWLLFAFKGGLFADATQRLDLRSILKCTWCLGWGLVGLTLRSRAMEKRPEDASPYKSTYLFVVGSSCLAVFALLSQRPVTAGGLGFYLLAPFPCILLGYRPILELREWIKDKS